MSHVNVLEEPETTGIRDAIHVAVVSLIAADTLGPGQRVVWKDKNVSVIAHVGTSHHGIGIVNPFVFGGYYHKGDKVWIMLYPNSVTGMTHHWSHPDFDSVEEEKFGLTSQSARSFIKNMAETLRVESDYLIELATIYCQHQSGCWPHDDFQASPEDWEVFWKAYSVVTGNPRPTENRVPFRCAC